MAQYLCIWLRAYWFSVTSFSEWLPGGHIGFFRFWTSWFRQCHSRLLWNFSFKFHVHVLCGCRGKPNDCQLWTMFNCNPPIAHCHPLLWGGGILVDRWSTISSLFLTELGCTGSSDITAKRIDSNHRWKNSKTQQNIHHLNVLWTCAFQ